VTGYRTAASDALLEQTDVFNGMPFLVNMSAGMAYGVGLMIVVTVTAEPLL